MDGNTILRSISVCIECCSIHWPETGKGLNWEKRVHSGTFPCLDEASHLPPSFGPWQ